MLNRYGLFEADEALRSAERRWQSSGSNEDKQAYLGVLRRSGRGKEADQIHMAPHIERYTKAADAAHKAQSAGGQRGERLRKETREAREEAAKHLHNNASEIDRHAGEFLDKRKGETPYDHVHRLATLHGSHHYGARSFTDGSHQVQFWRDPRVAQQHAGHLHKSIKHHYPHWESKTTDWAQGDAHKPKSAVRFHPGDEWHQPHQPTERK